jgi:hypothetical protein
MNALEILFDFLTYIIIGIPLFLVVVIMIAWIFMFYYSILCFGVCK